VNWQHAKDVAETVESILKSIGLLVAAAWAYWKFFLQAERETSISSRLQVSVLHCQESGHRLLEVRTTLTNNGKVPCEIDLSQSTVSVSQVTLEEQNSIVSCRTKLYAEGGASGDDLLNVPVGASMDIVEIVAVGHPGVYNISTFFAQTEQNKRLFYKRLRMTPPKDLSKDLVGWRSAAVILTHAPNMASTQSPSASISVTDRADTADSV
jgi:hypothetical protein